MSLRNAIHDLHTLFNHVVGFCDLLSEDMLELGEAAASSDLGEIRNEALSLLEALDRTFAAHVVSPAMEDATQARCGQMLKTGQDLERRLLSEQVALAVDDIGRINNALVKIPDLVRSIALMTTLNEAPGSLPVSLPDEEPARRASAEKAPPAFPDSPLDDRSEEQPEKLHAHILVVEDDLNNANIISSYLQRMGHGCSICGSGGDALRLLAVRDFDLILLDLMLPDMSGARLLEILKRGRSHAYTPVLMLSASTALDTVVRCLATGAVDYLAKPINPALLQVRVNTSLKLSRLQEKERQRIVEMEALLRELDASQKRATALLNNILPETISAELEITGTVQPVLYPEVTVVMIDVVGFTLAVERMDPKHLVDKLHSYFSAFDQLMGLCRLEKLKTVGDSYIFLAGLPTFRPSHAVDAVIAAFELARMSRQLATDDTNWQFRIGIHTGPVIAGVVGTRKFAYDVWGDSMNVASRMEACGSPGRINLSSATYHLIEPWFVCEPRGPVVAKDGRHREMFYAHSFKPHLNDYASFESCYRTAFGYGPSPVEDWEGLISATL